jgi:alpha-amylase/alpha-mannosidase (GH57 family)
MDKFKLCLVLHAHQPVGNFDQVFAHAVKTCYAPVLKILARYPEFKLSLHYSGPLLSWLEQNDPGFLDRVASLCASGQVEMLSGGYYEPLLAVIPARDAVAQVNIATEYTKRRFKQSPRGFWLAERIWEPGLPAKLAPCGLEYTLVDDTHLYYAGLSAKAMYGYHITEREGHPLALFPTHKELRYTIPFKEPQVTIDFLKQSLDQAGPSCATYGDDMEKFGLWPDTYEWVIQKGWLERFIEAVLENSDWLETGQPGSYMRQNPPKGRVYLPTASYEEMLTWALPAEASLAMEKLTRRLRQEGRFDAMRQFLRGGIWDNFLVKYPESNLMHKRMLHLSDRLDQASDLASTPEHDSAVDHLYQAQCNCAYWHGLFGGLYLSHLRAAIHQHLIQGETILDQALLGDSGWVRAKTKDLDLDGREEVILASPILDALVHPGYGGSLSMLDLRPQAFNLGLCLTRRKEAYHDHFNQATEQAGGSEEPKSPHEVVLIKEEGLEDYLIYDWYERRLFQDHFMPAGENLERFRRAEYTEWGDFVNQPYELLSVEQNEEGAFCDMRRQGHIWSPDGPWPVSVDKQCRITPDGGFEASYGLKANKMPDAPVKFAVELNFSLLAGDDPGKRIDLGGEPVIALDAPHEAGPVDGLKIVNQTDGFGISLELSRPAEVWCFPIETVSQSEAGLELTYQGSSLVLAWELPQGSLDYELKISLKIT